MALDKDAARNDMIRTALDAVDGNLVAAKDLAKSVYQDLLNMTRDDVDEYLDHP